MASSKPRAAIVHGQPVGPEKIQFAKLLRRTMTRPGAYALERSPSQPTQWIALPSAADRGRLRSRFFCDAARLAIELDGTSHDLRGERDESRDAELARLGIAVVRIANDNLMKIPTQ